MDMYFGYVLFVSALILSLFNAVSEIVAGKERFDREKKALHFVQRYTGLLAGQRPQESNPQMRGLKNFMAFRMFGTILPFKVTAISSLLGNLRHG